MNTVTNSNHQAWCVRTSRRSGFCNQLTFTALLCICLLPNQAQSASNFNYSQLQFQLGSAYFFDPLTIHHSAGADQYHGLLAWAISAGYQFDNGLILGASTTQGSSEKPLSRIESQVNSATLGYAIGLRKKLDIYGRIGFYTSEAEACNDQHCVSAYDESFGYDFGVIFGASHWFEYGFNLKVIPYTQFDESTSKGAHAAIWLDRYSSLATNFSHSDDSWATTVSYRFSF